MLVLGTDDTKGRKGEMKSGGNLGQVAKGQGKAVTGRSESKKTNGSK